jgi:hypothetical protein
VYTEGVVSVITKHSKDQSLLHCFRKGLGLEVIVDTLVDTDSLGTFSGEVERKDDPITCVKNKIQLGLGQTNARYLLASEGSFGPHPEIPFVSINEELLLFHDRVMNLDILERSISTATNFSYFNEEKGVTLTEFLQQVQFPSHGLILIEETNGVRFVEKDIVSIHKLEGSIRRAKQNSSNWHIETDMRAHRNPLRMEHIRQCAEKLTERIQTKCPACKIPGFGRTRTEPGLPCSICGLPTNSIRFHVFNCLGCSYFEKRERTDKFMEDPMYCNFCNP